MSPPRQQRLVCHLFGHLAFHLMCRCIGRLMHCSCLCGCRSDDSTGGADEVPLIMSEQSGFETDENEYLMRPRGCRGSNKRTIGYYLCDGWKDACHRFVSVLCLIKDSLLFRNLEFILNKYVEYLMLY